MFEIASSPIDTADIVTRFTHDSAGALSSFEGRVRDHHKGRPVKKLEYHVYEVLAIKEGLLILAEARDKFPIVDIKAVHRVGSLEIGETAIWIGALSAHRNDAFLACRYVIDNIKHRLPIWKKEFYKDGTIDWVGCTHQSKPEIKEEEYYSKQLLMPGVQVDGQERLKNARVAVVGAGGLGCPVLTNLAGAGVGHITVFDFDKVETSNLHRQFLYTIDDVGLDKAEAAKKRLQLMNPLIKIEAITQRVSSSAIWENLESYDIVVDGSDNLETKYYLNQICHKAGIPLVIAGVFHWQAILHTFFVDQESGCFNCLSDDAASDDCVSGCTDAGIIGVVPNMVGTLQANEVIRFLLGEKSKSATHGILIDLKDLSQHKIRRKRRDGCSVCGDSARYKNQSVEKLSSMAHSHEIESEKITKNPQRFTIVDIRPESIRSRNDSILRDWPQVKATNFEQLKNLPQTKDYILVCDHGLASLVLTNRLRHFGLDNFYSLKGGINSLNAVNS